MRDGPLVVGGTRRDSEGAGILEIIDDAFETAGALAES
jgi:hypothetical protein